MRIGRVLSWCLALSLAANVARAQAPAPVAPYVPPQVVFTGQSIPLPPGVEERAQLLEWNFRVIQREAKNRDWLLGGVLVVGTGLVTVGSVYAKKVGALLIPIGALGVIRGATGLLFMRDPTVIAGQFLRLPAFDARQVRDRIRFGEQALAALALQERRARIVDGSISVAIASSYVPLAVLLARQHDSSYRFRDDSLSIALLAISVVNVGAALVSTLRPTVNELRYRAYQELSEEQEKKHPHALDKLSFGVGGARRGFALTAGARF